MPTTRVTTAAYALAPGETLSTVNENTLVVVGQPLMAGSGPLPATTVTIAGAISLTGTAAVTSFAGLFGFTAQDLRGNSTVDLLAGSAITVHSVSARSNVYGIYTTSGEPVIHTAAAIDVTGSLDAYGLYLGGSRSFPTSDTVTNTGVIHATSSGGAATGIYFGSGDTFSNSGTIEAGGASAYGVKFFQFGTGFLNTGVIRAIDTDPTDGVVAVAADLNTTIDHGFVNTGTLEGDIALRFKDYNGPPSFSFQDVPVRFENYGQLLGRVELGINRQVLLNSGQIRGDVDLGSGDDTYAGSAGSAVGLIQGGDGADSLLGGAAYDYLQGNAGNDTVVGGEADDWLLGGRGDDVLRGGGGANILYGNLDNDFLDGGGGNDLIRGGQANDVLLGQTGDDFLSGDKGDDTLTGGDGADIFHTFGDAELDRVTDFSLAQGDRVQLDPGTQYTVAQSGADTVISMTGGARMVLVGVQMSTLTPGWIFGA